MPIPDIIQFPAIRRTSAAPQGIVRHLETANGTYAEFVYGSGNVDLTDAVIRNWIGRIIFINNEQNIRINNGENIPPLFTNGEPEFVRQFRTMNEN